MLQRVNDACICATYSCPMTPAKTRSSARKLSICCLKPLVVSAGSTSISRKLSALASSKMKILALMKTNKEKTLPLMNLDGKSRPETISSLRPWLTCLHRNRRWRKMRKKIKASRNNSNTTLHSCTLIKSRFWLTALHTMASSMILTSPFLNQTPSTVGLFRGKRSQASRIQHCFSLLLTTSTPSGPKAPRNSSTLLASSPEAWPLSRWTSS